MNEPWEVRRASLHDREALEALCRDAVGREDYVIERLEALILRGVMHVALDGDRIIGMMHYSEAIDGSAWLGTARTHPDYQRRGVATALIGSAAGLARRSRVGALRLWSSASNRAGTAAVLANGFREVARFTRVRRGTRRGTSAGAPLSFQTDLVREIGESEVLRLANGYVPYEHYLIQLTPANVHLLAGAGALFRVAGGVVVVSTNREDPDPPGKSAEIGLASGDPSKVLKGLPGALGRSGVQEIRSFLPHDPKVLDAARDAGYEEEPWGREAVLYERTVDVGPTSYRKRRTYAEIAAGKREGYAALALLVGGHGHGHDGPHEDRWNR